MLDEPGKGKVATGKMGATQGQGIAKTHERAVPADRTRYHISTGRVDNLSGIDMPNK